MVQQAANRTRRTSHNPSAWADVGHQTHDWSEANCMASQPDSRPRPQFADQMPGIVHQVLSHQRFGAIASSDLRQRLENANAHFRRKAGQVLDDADAMQFLDDLYNSVVVDIPDTEISKAGICLAKLTAANFCEVGGNVVYITYSGRRFVESIKGT